MKNIRHNSLSNAFEAVMHSWEFINHLGEAAMGLTFGEIRVRPTLCPTLQDFLPHSFGSCLL